MTKHKSFIILLLVVFSSIALAQFKLDEQSAKLVYTLNAVNSLYVDSVKENNLVESAIVGMLKDLDPHSVYIPKDEVERMNEPLEGSFYGIGIQFQMLEDTLYVIQTISGCPAAKVGVLPGDRMIFIEDTLIAGPSVKMQNTAIMKKLRGPRGTVVRVKMLRRGVPELIDFSITRDKIPIYSVDASYMIDKEVGYIKINSFGATTYREYLEALDKLRKAGMKDLIIDLQDNGGGYMNAATDLANEFLQQGNLIVYTKGVKQPRTSINATGKGGFSNGRLIVLTNEYSASASEIFSGAMQDWDRGVVVGRRTFGKGLVQRPVILPDGSMIRLTTARYYTPSGRCIQKSYKDGLDKYEKDILDRYKHGEFQHADSIHFADSLKYKTLRLSRTVYGGGGIMPDVFVPLDTTYYSDYLRKIIAKGIVNKTTMQYIDKNRNAITEQYKTFDTFAASYSVPQSLFDDLASAATKEKITFNQEQFDKSKAYLSTQIKAMIANDIWERDAFYRIVNTENAIVKKALDLFKQPGAYNKLLTPSTNTKKTGK
ncbi:S41 family peptidase [Paludibacter sp.]|uniref:S41 family peptidase n=1 Tax=Paludibacter sp. TaxID=1898105 RepID=UPI00135281E3|nr:S41 family peptidase [Paludibacter sp.]MTK53084.1 S41 family peptidase [Paludibacter sp.]